MLHNNFPYYDPLQHQDQTGSIQNFPLTQAPNNLQPGLQTQASSIVAVDSQALPPGWERVIDQEHGTYYIDHITKRTQYERPYEVELTKGAMGFGFTLVEADSGLLLVRSVIPGGPAYMNGTIRPGDILISAVGVPVTGIQHTDIARLFSTFSIGDRVRLTFARSNYVLDDNLVPDEYLFSNGTNGDLAIAVNPNNQIAANDHDQFVNAQMNQSSQILVEEDEYEFVRVMLRRGDQGFGFTISDSNAGQKVRRIQNHEVCANLRQGDILISLNEKDILKLTHKEVVEELKRCPAGEDVTLVVKRKKRFRSKTPLEMHSYQNKSDFSHVTKPHRNCKTPSLDGLMLNRLNNPQVQEPSESPRLGPDLNQNPIFNQHIVQGAEDFETYNGESAYGLSKSNQQTSNHHQNQMHGFGPLSTQQQPIYCNQNDPNITNTDLNNAPSLNDAPGSLEYSGTIDNPINSEQHIEPSYTLNASSNIPTNQLDVNQYDAFMNNDKLLMMQMQQEHLEFMPYPPASNYHDVPLYSNSVILNEPIQTTYGPVPSLPSKPPINQIPHFQAPDDNYQSNFYANNEEIAQQKVQYDLSSKFQPLNDQQQHFLQPPLMMQPANEQFNYVQSSLSQEQAQTPHDEHDEYEYYHVELTRENTDSNWGIRLIGGAEVDRAISIGSMIFGGVAAKSGKLKSGDEIISIDHNSVVGATHQHVVEMISARTNQVQLVVRRKKFAEACDVVLTKNMDEGFGFVIISSENCALIGKIIPGSPADRCKQLRVRDCIIAVNGRYITPDMKHPELVNMIKECGSTLRLRIIPVDCYTVKIVKDNQNDSFGFRMRGGSEYDGTPLYIVRVETNGQAHGLLNVGDQILEINNIPTIGMTHSQAATIIKYSDPAVKLKLRRNYVTPPSLLVDSPRALQKYNQVTAEMKAVSRSLADSREELATQNGAAAIDPSVGSLSSLPAGVDGMRSEQQFQHEHPALVGVLDDGFSNQRYPVYEHHSLPLNYLDDEKLRAH